MAVQLSVSAKLARPVHAPRAGFRCSAVATVPGREQQQLNRRYAEGLGPPHQTFWTRKQSLGLNPPGSVLLSCTSRYQQESVCQGLDL